MPNYQNGKIYSIRSHQTDDIYIGSTAQPKLSLRMGDHRKDYRRYLNGKKVYLTSFEILKYEDAYIELIDFYPCNSKMELEREEGKYQREMDCVNKMIAGRTLKEYREDNKEVILAKAKEHRINNLEKYKEKDKTYYDKNREAILKQKKEYHEENRITILAKNNVKTECKCGGHYTTTHKQRHLKTDKHQNYIKEQDNN